MSHCHGVYPDDARAVGSALLRRHSGQRSGVEGQRIPSGLGRRGSGGGGGTGRAISLLTASLLSAEYHHSRSLSRNTPSGMRLVASRCKTVIVGGEASVVVSSLICRDIVTPASTENVIGSVLGCCMLIVLTLYIYLAENNLLDIVRQRIFYLLDIVRQRILLFCWTLSSREYVFRSVVSSVTCYFMKWRVIICLTEEVAQPIHKLQCLQITRQL